MSALERLSSAAQFAGTGTAGMAAVVSAVPTYYEAAERGKRFIVIENPSGAWSAEDFPTLEAAQAHALALNEWIAARPDPTMIDPFFDSRVVPEFDPLAIDGILGRMLVPEANAERELERVRVHARAALRVAQAAAA